MDRLLIWGSQSNNSSISQLFKFRYWFCCNNRALLFYFAFYKFLSKWRQLFAIMLLQNQLPINRKKFAERWIYRKSTVFFLCDFIYCWFDFMLICFLEVGYWYQFQLFSRSTSQICNICTHFVTIRCSAREVLSSEILAGLPGKPVREAG